MRNLAVLSFLAFAVAGANEHPTGVSADDALRMLVTGNARYASNKEIRPNATLFRRKLVLDKGQHPYAAVLGCADSRVPPELVFDAGLGDLFVMRVAGNTADDEILGSMEYAVEHLGVRLIVVLGHEKCGAVSAAVAGGEVPGHIVSLVKAIAPSVEESKKQGGDAVHNCVVNNARRVARQVREAGPILHEMVLEGKLRVVAADYDLGSGVVTFLDGPVPKPAEHAAKPVQHISKAPQKAKPVEHAKASTEHAKPAEPAKASGDHGKPVVEAHEKPAPAAPQQISKAVAKH